MCYIYFLLKNKQSRKSERGRAESTEEAMAEELSDNRAYFSYLLQPRSPLSSTDSAFDSSGWIFPQPPNNLYHGTHACLKCPAQSLLHGFSSVDTVKASHSSQSPPARLFPSLKYILQSLKPYFLKTLAQSLPLCVIPTHTCSVIHQSSNNIFILVIHWCHKKRRELGQTIKHADKERVFQMLQHSWCS